MFKQLAPLETKKIDLRKYFIDQSQPVYFTIKRFSKIESARYLAKAKVLRQDGKLDEDNIDYFVFALMTSVVDYPKDKLDNAPWNEETIEALIKQQPGLIDDLLEAIEELNAPLAKQTSMKSSK